MPQQLYLDNASTAFPKAPGVAEAVGHFITHVGMNVSRGSYAPAFAAAEVVWETRERLCALVGSSKPQNVIFTANVTQSLNMLLKGLLRPGDHVLTSPLEHNALVRPLAQLAKEGVRFTHMPLDASGTLATCAIEALIEPRTRAIFMTHGSNVSGAVLPVHEVGQIARRHGLFLVVDTAQTAGLLELDMTAMGIDGLAFTGHKGLLGPQGIGGFILSDALAAQLSPLITGGTGSMSDSQDPPPVLPDRFEAGTLNLPGIYGLHTALGYINAAKPAALLARERALAQRLEAGLAELPGVRCIGPEDWQRRMAIVSVDCTGHDNATISYRLAEEHGILTRCGLHCAPWAHKALGTYPQGTVRFSPSHATTEAEIDTAIAAMAALLG